MSAPRQVGGDPALRRSLGPEAPVVYWQLGATLEQRYDLPDQPMQGEMDPFFFLARHKNFIPHEYPCRTSFIAERRGKRPLPQGQWVASGRNWLPFGSPRVDLSGFWFRPTVLGTWARGVIVAASPGRARLRLRSCGGAVLYVAGEEAGWLAQYARNLEAAVEFETELRQGANDVRIWFDDLAERDARYYFQLDYLDGPAAESVLPITVSGDIAGAMESALEAMRFERPSYSGGEVALVTDTPLPTDLEVSVSVEGESLVSRPFSFVSRAGAGSTRLPVADAEDLPADFRHFRVAVAVPGFSAERVLGVEICHARRQGDAPGSLTRRIDEALDHVAEHGERDPVRALARLATGRAGAATEAMIEAALPMIAGCHDCADFMLVPVLWCRRAFAAALAPELCNRIDSVILGYRYWLDEPGNDVQWYFSENHALLFHTSAYLAGRMLPEARFGRSGRTGAEQSAVGLQRVLAWLDHFETWEMAEFNSAPYFPIDLKGLTTLFALAPDAGVRRRSGAAIQRLLEIVARSAHRGVLTGAQGRSYEHTLIAGRSLELCGVARMLWGKGHFGTRFHELPQLALCLRDHRLEVPAAFAPMAVFERNDAQEWCFAQGQDRIARLYHYKTRHHAMGSAALYRWNEWGYQETVLHLRLGDDPDAQVWINHPGETIHSGYGRPSYWGGSGTLPRVQQYRGLAVAVFDCAPEQPDFTHAWFPQAAFDEVRLAERHAGARSGHGLVFIGADGPLLSVDRGPAAGNELRAPGRRRTWVARLGDTAANGDLDDFLSSFSGLMVQADDDGVLRVADPEYGEVRFCPNGRVEAEGRVLDPGQWTIGGHAAFMVRASSSGG